MPKKYQCKYCPLRFNKLHHLKKHREVWKIDAYKYTKTWFLESELMQKIKLFVDPYRQLSVLEIGSYEGLSACYFSEKLLNHTNSTLICVDPFYKSNTVEGITGSSVDENTKKMFLHNIKKSKNSNKISFCNKESDEFFKINKKKFDFIYIDGCHNIDYIRRDIINSHNALNKGGIIWIDDYRSYKGALMKDIDNIINQLSDVVILHKNYQLAIKKL